MKNMKETIRKMVTYLNNPEKDGGFWLPNIQRPFVWNKDQIVRLFDSIMRDYPISTLLAWKTKSSIKRRTFIANYRGGIKLSDFYVPEDAKTKQLVLDGQQRLQSLFIGLKGSYDRKELYFDVLSGDIVAPEDVRYGFKFQEPQKAVFPWIKFKDIVFDNEMPNKVAEAIIRTAGVELDDNQNDRIMTNIWKVNQVFVQNEILTYQELDSVDNPEIYSEDDVVEIFIRANSGGTKLGKSDLLFSLLTVSWEDADDKMEELLDDLNRSGYDFTRDFILKTCLTLLKKGARYDVQKFRDGSTKDGIVDGWDKISAAIKDVKDFLYGKTFIRTDRALPSYLGIIPIIYFRYHYPDKWKRVTEVDEYVLRTLLTGAFSGTPDNLIDKCTKLIDDQKDFSVAQLFGTIRADGRSLEITKDTILGLHYGSKDIHLLFNIWYRDFNYIPSYANNLPQVDHIFPQSLLRSVKDVSPETGRRSLLHYTADLRDQVANCMLLTAQENGAGGKSDIPPDKWFADKSDDYLNMHLIPKDKDLWKLENYDEFIQERKLLILQNFDSIIQKEVL